MGTHARSLAVVAATLAGLAGGQASGQEPESGTPVMMRIMARSAVTDVAELRRLDGLIDALVRSDALALASRQPDLDLQGREHESYGQYHEGVPVHGGGVTRQFAGGITISIFGTIHEDIDIVTTPRLSPNEALARLERHAGVAPATDDPPTLVVLPTLLGAYALVWKATMGDRRTYFLDAHTGNIAHDESDVFEQTPTGVGSGIRGQRKKLSTSSAGGAFHAYDRLRPAEIVTLDLRYNETRADDLVDSRGPHWVPSDVANDTDNLWDDPAVVDGHAYTGFAYDYFARQGWDGLDGRNSRMVTMVNIGSEGAFFAPPPYGPEKTGVVALGHGHDGTPLVAADIVAHEIMHGVTHFSVWRRTGQRDGLLNTFRYITGPSSFTLPLGGRPHTFRCGQRFRYGAGAGDLAGRVFYFACQDGRFLLFANHGGAIHEAYSDIFGTAVEFSIHDEGSGPLRAEYSIGEDTGEIVRSLENPREIMLSAESDIPYPDAYRRLVRFLVEVRVDRDEAFFSNLGSVDGGRSIVFLPSHGYSGVHWNSTILSHAFYLAIEGGRNATTGRTVRGVGGADREQIERVFFRAMTSLMPAATDIPMAAAVVRQSAVDLFGAGSPTHRAIREALHAVGL